MAGLLVMAMVGSGCARLVTLNPLEVAASNDAAWKIRNEPAVDPLGNRPQPVTPIGAAPIPMRERPEVQQALRSPPDSLGIPGDLYAADPILTAHRNEMRAEESARNHVGAGIVLLGLAFGAYSAWAISTGLKDGDSPDQDRQTSGAQLVASGSIITILALGEVIAGVVMIATSPSTTPLTGYYQETYTDRR
ncbi:MAG TPA: hypothetical protein VLC06_24695 [Polyangia bacterium]|jgi:hypothetical protein|nr:hypothetical protein [Polyangia bacterium]